MICRHHWLTACNGALDDDPFWDALNEASASTARGLRGMLEVMVGSQEALQGATVGWLELLVAELLHCYPTLHPASHLVPLMQRCQSDMEGAGLGQAGGEPSPLLPFVDGLIQVDHNRPLPPSHPASFSQSWTFTCAAIFHCLSQLHWLFHAHCFSLLFKGLAVSRNLLFGQGICAIPCDTSCNPSHTAHVLKKSLLLGCVIVSMLVPEIKYPYMKRACAQA